MLNKPKIICENESKNNLKNDVIIYNKINKFTVLMKKPLDFK